MFVHRQAPQCCLGGKEIYTRSKKEGTDALTGYMCKGDIMKLKNSAQLNWLLKRGDYKRSGYVQYVPVILAKVH